jgi:hypothetical protein
VALGSFEEFYERLVFKRRRIREVDHCLRAGLGRIPFVGSMTRIPDSSLDRFEVKRRLAHLA